jgi:hypothetical protein
MRDLLRGADGRRLDLSEYESDFYATVDSLDSPILKTERSQSFREPGSPSWEAFAAGRWDEALRSAARPAPELVDFLRRLGERGSGLWRTRIVERPLTPYLIWELHFLRHRAEAGERIRVLDAGLVTEFEARHGTVPELMVAGSQAVYEVLYDDSGTPVGAVKFVDRATVAETRSRVSTLYDMGEAFDTFFDREVAGRRPPVTVL